jgi:hypothetical protein
LKSTRRVADVLDVDQILAFLDVVADADVAQADHAANGALMRMSSPTLAAASWTAASCTFSVAAELSSACCADEFLLQQLLVALVVALGQREIGLRLLQFRLLDGWHRG